ncbi:Serine protease Do-like HtrB [Caloramator mitchellensis]|uniref:Serine protease Do-like HtrB n=1 Tax=Caloramator mitchellensis TaxID=908809 RepID=A0A0R3JTF8_CALMK|nr:trypsin-like peptidase domain-containing protein [Caloramator mitchellensis]KRQ86298.1 Serine protease Do-like HtrB [Caloramator mitchellensis]
MEERYPSLFGYFLSGLIGALIGGVLIILFFPIAIQGKQETNEPEQRIIIEKSTDFSYASNKVVPSVVSITSKKQVASGFIIDKNGYIATNSHVLDGDITVTLTDGREYTGRIVFEDRVLDLAIVKIEETNLDEVILGDSNLVNIGDSVLAIGNPLNLRFHRSVTAGIVSGKDITIEVEKGKYMEDLLQTDAAINPGNSGGPLINLKGEVIGINSVKASSYEGIGFAIPINIIKPILKSLREKGNFVMPTLGLRVFDSETARYYNYNIDKGIYVYEVIENGPGFNAGIKEGDVILSIDGVEVNKIVDLKEELYLKEVGSIAVLKVKDPIGLIREVKVTLDSIDNLTVEVTFT